jgi:hypothetical protein
MASPYARQWVAWLADAHRPDPTTQQRRGPSRDSGAVPVPLTDRIGRIATPPCHSRTGCNTGSRWPGRRGQYAEADTAAHGKSGSADPEEAARLGVTVSSTHVRSNGLQLAELGRLLDAGTVHVAIDSTFPLAQAREAHGRASRGHIQGKIVLTTA